ncbi:MAG: hypothetical protein M1838_005301 [Thelocarpon superellum]|nr:MAG: hypothetical protein M1838_005301 [Thelocarpon superellum]
MRQVSKTYIAEGEPRPGTSDGKKPDMWSSMLDGVASGKRLPEKTLLVLGGSSESQRSFLEGLSDDPSSSKAPDRPSTKASHIANQFALGYAYHDVLDTDHEDTLARLSLYLLSDPSPAFTPLLRPLLTPHTIRNTLLVVLLDWAQPWAWLRQLRQWIRLLRSLLTSLDDDCKEAMEETMISWRDRGRGGATLDGGEGGAGSEGDISLPLGPGEWDEALGMPLCVVCQHADHIDVLEKDRGWREEEFDFVLQFIRTILLKHGASLIYTSASAPHSLQSLVHSSLGIQSLLKRQALKHNVIDRSKILIPPNWDSWGKIRVLREGFDVEGVSTGWSRDIESLPIPTPNEDEIANKADDGHTNGETAPTEAAATDSTALGVYEDTIRDPRGDNLLDVPSANDKPTPIEVECLSTQEFLAKQVEVLETLRVEEEQGRSAEDAAKDASTRQAPHLSTRDRMATDDSRRVNEHIGPVQFNMGGIQVDADDMLKRLKEREALRTPEPQSTNSAVASPDGKSQNEALASFFAGLMKRGGSAANSPRSN